MTRTEFIEDVTCFDELIDFCYNEGIDYCDNIYTEEAKNEYIDNMLVEMARQYSWQELLDILEGIPDDYRDDYYRLDEYDDTWDVLDAYDFDEIKGEVLEYMDDGEYWDEEEEEFVEDYYDDNVEEEIEEDNEPEEGGCSISELITSVHSTIGESKSSTTDNEPEACVGVEDLFEVDISA